MSEIDRLRSIMRRLRGPDGCPWDREQTYETLRTYLVEETYELLNYTVNRKWQWRDSATGSPIPPGATDDLAVGLTMNPDMKLLVVHGLYDLVTPYFESKYLLRQLADGSEPANDVQFAAYEGGHMFYMWQASRRAFTRDTRKLY